MTTALVTTALVAGGGGDQRIVARKRLRDHWVADAGVVRAFREERDILASLDDAHVVRPVDRVGGIDGDLPFEYCMERAEFGSLGLAVRDGGMARASVVAILEQVRSGLASFHAAGVAHGDLREGNVLLFGDASGAGRVGGPPIIAKLADPNCGVGVRRPSRGADLVDLDAMVRRLLDGTPASFVSLRSARRPAFNTHRCAA